jgi:hypothetical protein
MGPDRGRDNRARLRGSQVRIAGEGDSADRSHHPIQRLVHYRHSTRLGRRVDGAARAQQVHRNQQRIDSGRYEPSKGIETTTSVALFVVALLLVVYLIVTV